MGTHTFCRSGLNASCRGITSNCPRGRRCCIWALHFGAVVLLFGLRAANQFLVGVSELQNMPLQLHVIVKQDSGTSTASGRDNDLQQRDNLAIGKSCRLMRRLGMQWWKCQDCGLDVAKSNITKCRTLKRRGICYPLRQRQWDNPPRYQSQFDPARNQQVGLRTLNTVGRTKTYESQPVCTVLSCFDLSKCKDVDSKGLAVFVNTTGPHELLDYAVAAAANYTDPFSGLQLIPTVRRVDRYQDACLVLVTKDTYMSPVEIVSARHWQGGRNNLVWDLSFFNFPNHKQLGPDEPFNFFHLGYAAVANVAFSEAHLRQGYDMALTLQVQWGRSVPPSEVDIHRPRKWLLSFKGKLIDIYGLSGSVLPSSPYYLHRWMAAEYWEDAPDVLADVRCVEDKLFPPRRNTGYVYASQEYGDIMWNTTFGFAPGGNSVGSFRFGEILSVGGIPVVTQDFLAPLEPEIDWSGCLVRVSEARVVDLPRILRAFSFKQIRKRQRVCWHLYQTFLGDTPRAKDGKYATDEKVTFTKAMELWATRISTALRTRKISEPHNDRLP